MPRAPKPHRPANQPSMQQQRRLQDRFRGSAQSRGYTAQWSAYANQLCRQRVFCQLCSEVGIETCVVRPDTPNESGERRKPVSVVDHVIPVDDGQNDTLFWETANHWALCTACHNWKSIAFDGGWGKLATPATRTLAGIEQRRREIVARFKAERGR